MRKQNKIISLVLVVALLLSAIVIVPVAAADEPATTFTPSATWETAEDANDAVSSAGSAGLSNRDEASISAYVVTPANGDKYVTLVAEASTTSQDHYLDVGSGATGTALDFESGYYVIEMDLASESGMIENFTVNPIIPVSSGSGSARLDPNPNDYLANHTVLSDGNWHHYAMVGDLAKNELKIYIDGVLVDTKEGNAYNAGAKATDTEYKLDSIRVNISASKDMTIGNSLSINNISMKVGTNSTYGTAPAVKSLPAIAEVNGVEYSSVSAINKAIFDNKAVDVEVLRDFAGTITVNCDATVNTNGCTGTIEAGTNVKKTDNGDNTYTFDAPYQQSAISTVTEDENSIFNTVKSPKTGNLFKSIGNNVKSANGMTTEIVGNTLQKSDYFKVTSTDTPNNAYIDVNSNTKITPNNNTQFYVFEMDFAILNSSVDVSCVPNPRDISGFKSLRGATVTSLSTILADYNVGEMQHITIVINLDANTGFVFVNDILAKGDPLVWTSQENYDNFWAGGESITFNGMRIGQDLAEGGGYIFDNVYIQYVEDAATGYAADSLTAAMAAGDLSVWAGATTEIATQVAPLAKVDGEYVYSAAALNEVLSIGRTQKQVEFLRDETATITVNVDAVVETNGLLKDKVKAGDGITSSTKGTITTFDAPWKSSVSKTDKVTYESLLAETKDYTVGNNIFSGYYIKQMDPFGESADGRYPTVYLATNNGTGDVYLYRAGNDKYDAGSMDAYMEMKATPTTMTHSDSDPNYIVLEFDYARDAAATNFNFLYYNTNHNTEGSTYSRGSIDLTSVVNALEMEKFYRITVIADVYNNKSYAYVDGVQKATGTVIEDADTTNYQNGTTAITFSGFRVSQDSPDTYIMDNIAMRVVKDSSYASIIASGNLNDWKGTTKAKTSYPSIAIVNNVEYNSISALNEALSKGENLTISLDRVPVGTATVSTTATIVTNGFDNFIKARGAYTIISNNDGTYTVQLETRMGTITVNINGKAAIEASVLYGTDIAEYLRLNNSYVFDVISSDAGQVYTGVKWKDNVTPAGYVDGDVVYDINDATAYGEAALVLNASTGAVVSGVTDLKTALTTGADYIIVMNSDYKFDSNNVQPQNDNTVYMAGHRITFAEESSDTKNHAFTLNAATHSLQFINGAICDDVRIDTQSIWFAGYDFVSEFKCIGVDIYAVSNVGTICGGTFTFENCNINVLECQNTNAFKLCEYYDTNVTYVKCVLNLIDSDIQFTHFSGDRNAALVNFKSYTDAPENLQATALSKDSDKLIHEINISGCNIRVAMGAYLYTSESDNSINCHINIDNTQLNVKMLYGRLGGCKMNIGDNVVSAAPITGVNFGTDVIEINSGKPEAPYGYANDYATVIWSDGTTEKWADGTYPVNANFKTDNVCKVEAGKTYTFKKANVSDLAMKVNLTLDSELKLNVYIPKNFALTALNIGGVEYVLADAESVTFGGVEYNKYVYELLPYMPAVEFGIVVTTENYTIARSFSLLEYANLVEDAYAGDEEAIQLVRNLLNYVKEAHYYMGAYTENYDEIVKFLGESAATAVTPPAEGTNTMTNVGAYLSGAQLNLESAPKWRFMVVAGAELSDLKITVSGVEVEYINYGDYVEFEVPAYNLLKTITVTVGDVTGTYNFAAYYAKQNGLAGSITGTTAGANIVEAQAYASMNLLKALYSYASYADAYKN